MRSPIKLSLYPSWTAMVLTLVLSSSWTSILAVPADASNGRGLSREVSRRVQNASWRLYAFSGRLNKFVNVCTAFASAYHRDGTDLHTAGHCVILRDRKEMYIENQLGETHPVSVEAVGFKKVQENDTVPVYDEMVGYDWATLHTESHLPALIPPARSPPFLFQRVWILGFPLEGAQVGATGIIGSMNYDTMFSAYDGYLQTDADVFPGSSGAAVINRNGCFVGIVASIRHSGITAATPLSKMKPADVYKPRKTDNNVVNPTAPASPPSPYIIPGAKERY